MPVTEPADTLPALSDEVLTDRLGHLVAAGEIPGRPTRARYGSTEHGRAVGPVHQVLWDWGARSPAP